MALTYETIQTYIATSSVSDITFSSIPATYTDLIIKGSARCSVTNSNYGYWVLTLNSTSADYQFTRVIGYVNGIDSNGDTTNPMYVGSNTEFTGWTSNTFSNVELYILDYAGANPKPINFDGIIENNSQSSEKAFQEINNARWNNTAAITSIKIAPGTGSFVTNTRITLYGILKTP